jgi:hypothetical protein
MLFCIIALRVFLLLVDPIVLVSFIVWIRKLVGPL